MSEEEPRRAAVMHPPLRRSHRRLRSDARLGRQVANWIAIGCAAGQASGDADRDRCSCPEFCAPRRAVLVSPRAYPKLDVVAGVYEALGVFGAGHVVMGMRHALCDHAFGVGVAIIGTGTNGGGARGDSG